MGKAHPTSLLTQKGLKQVIRRKDPSKLLAVAGSVELPVDASTNEDWTSETKKQG